MLNYLHPCMVATGPVSARAIGRELWVELMVIKKPHIPSGIFTPCRSGREADFFFFNFIYCRLKDYCTGPAPLSSS